MKVNQVISNIDKNSGGTSTYVQGLSKFLSKRNLNLTISTRTTKYPLNFENEIKLNFFDDKKTKLNFKKKLNFDIFHINGLWELFVHKMVLLAKKEKIPYIVSPHGMLEQWSLNQGKFKKKIALFLYQRRDLSESDCIHVTAVSEMESVRRLGLMNPIAIIPNGIDISNFPKGMHKSTGDKKTLLFLSRIHPKKGIESLIEAWAELNHPKKANWQIKIVGNGTNAYIRNLKNMILAKNLLDSVIILPPIFDTEKKIEVFRKADVFVLPTFSENFGIVIAEALASYTPVITTKGTPWEDLISKNCGWWIDTGVTPLRNTLLEVLNTDIEVLNLMGENGRKLIEEEYSIEVIAGKTLKMYDWVMNKCNKPNFIYQIL